MVVGGGRGHTVGLLEPRRVSKTQPQRVEFRRGGRGSFMFSELRRTGTERLGQSRMGPPWGKLRPSSVLPGKGRFLLASGDQGHQKQDGPGRCPSTCRV